MSNSESTDSGSTKILRQLIALPAVLGTLLAITGITGVVISGRISRQINLLNERALGPTLAFNEISTSLGRLSRGLLRVGLTSTDGDTKKELLKSGGRSLKKVSKMVEAQFANSKNQPYEAYLKKWYSTWNEFQTDLNFRMSDPKTIAANLGTLDTRTSKLVEDMGNVNEFIQSDVKEILDDATSLSAKARTILLTCLGIGLLIGFVFTWNILQRVKKLLKTIDEKTSEVIKRNDTIEMIYQNVKSGFLLVNSQSLVQEGYTQSCSALIGKNFKSGKDLPALLGMNTRMGDHFRLMVEQVFEDILPEDLALEQIPSWFTISSDTSPTYEPKARVINLQGSVVRDRDSKVTAILFTVNDITSLEAAEKENRRNAALMKVIKRKEAFSKFIEDTREMIQKCSVLVKGRTDESSKLRFNLHTIKGNAASFSITELASKVHEVEEKPVIDLADLALINSTLDKFLKDCENAFGESLINGKNRQKTFPVSESDFEQLIVLGNDSPKLLAWASEMQMEKSGKIFEHFANHAKEVAAKLGKRIEVQITSPERRMDNQHLEPLLNALCHAVRNAVDHGLEHSNERKSKPEVGRLRLGIASMDSEWVITIEDDGRGIDPEKVSTIALKKGLVTSDQVKQMTDDQKTKLIFREGFSTASDVTEISGRGIGMSALRDVVESMKGRIEIDSKIGKGTKMSFIIPKQQKGLGLLQKAS